MESFLLLIFLLLIFLSLLMIFLQRIRLSAIKEVESKSASTVTSESGEQQHQKLLNVSSQTVSRTSGLLSSLKVVTLRKSCVTRQALRVEVVGGRKLEGRKSSSGKSGVGSSSHPGYNVKNTTLRASLNKDVTPDNNQNAMRAPQANCDKVRKSNISKESTAKTRDLTFKSGCGSKIIAAAKSAHLETAKSKVNKVVHSKATRLHRVNAQDSVTGATKANDKVGVNKYNRLGNGKENVTSQRPNTGAGGTVQQVQIVTKQKSIVPKTRDPEIAENRDTLVAPPRKSVVEPVDEWAFLDEIEAPMWVDLNLEAASGYKDNDDNWFKISHLSHQSSSQQLISAFSCVGEGNTNKTSSPKLPRLVSKNYRIKDSGQSNCYGIASNKHHPIKNLISTSSGLNSSEKIKPKPSNGNRRGNARSKVNSVCSYPNPSPNFGNSKTGSSPAAIKEIESKSASTITSESGEEQHRKLLNVSSQKVSRTSGLLSSEMGSSNIKRRREKLSEEARESVPEPGSGRVMHLVKAFEKLLTIPKDSDQTDEKQSEDVGDDDDDKKGMKWALPGLQQPKVPETLISSSSFFPPDFFVTSESLGLDLHVSSSLDGSHGSFTISNRTSGGGHRSRRNSSESSGTFGGSRWKKKQLKATYQKPFKLRTEQRGRYKEEEFVKKVQKMMMEEEKQRIPIARGLPWTTDEPECLVKPAVKEIPRPVDLVLHSDVRAVKRAEFDQQLAKKMSLIEQYREKRERQQKLAEEEEIRRLRKELIPRAQLMPYFDRPFIPRRSMKHCTISREPKFHIPPQHKGIKCGMC